jgi:hypothetical protein
MRYNRVATRWTGTGADNRIKRASKVFRCDTDSICVGNAAPFLTTFSTARLKRGQRKVRMDVNDEEAAVAYFKVMSRHLFEGTGGNHEERRDDRSPVQVWK